MTNTTETYWDIDGVSLQTYAFNITTLGGDRLAPPPTRGDDLTIPYVPGQRYMPKQVSSRVITLGMWVIGADEAGNRPMGQDREREFDDNWRKLRQLFWVYDREFILTKRFYVDGELKIASAKASFAGGLNPTMSGPQRAVFTVDIKLTDPYFYSNEVVVPLVNGSQTISVDGDDTTRAIRFEIEGSRTNPKVRNNTYDVQFEYHAVLGAEDQVDVNVKDYTSITYPDGGESYPSVGDIRHEGDPSWLILKPGNNAIVVSSSSGLGQVTMAYREVWL